MKYNKFFLIFLCLFNFNTYASDKRHKFISEIVHNYEKKIIQKGFRPIGIGEGIDHDTGKQNFLKIVSNVNCLPNIEYARKLIIESINDFLFEINSNERARPYLNEYPFTINSIDIGIIAEKKDGLICVTNYKNYLSYYAKNPDPYGESWIKVHEETFEEALKFLNRNP